MKITDIKSTLDLVSWMIMQPGVYRCAVRVSRMEAGPHATMFQLKWYDDSDTMEHGINMALPDKTADINSERWTYQTLAKRAAHHIGVFVD